MTTGEFPVRLTERSATAIREWMRGHPDRAAARILRVVSEGGSAGLHLVPLVDPATDLVDEAFGIYLAVPRQHAAALAGYVIDYRSIGPEIGFVLKDPRSMHSRASDPGGLPLAQAKLRRLQPDLFSGEGGFLSRLLGRRDPGVEEYCEGLTEHLQTGDSRAAVVVSAAPLVVAAYTDELDCVALLRFPDYLVAEHNLRVGSRLLTVNLYQRDRNGGRASDLVPGPRDTGQFTNFTPLIADFLTTDVQRLSRRKAAIGEDEWARVAEMGRELLSRGSPSRDGRPLRCGNPATEES